MADMSGSGGVGNDSGSQHIEEQVLSGDDDRDGRGEGEGEELATAEDMELWRE